jgi:hypothetical protein
MARTLRHANHSTVQGWWERDVVPAHQQAPVLVAARSLKLIVEPVDLIPGLSGEQLGSSPRRSVQSTDKLDGAPPASSPDEAA